MPMTDIQWRAFNERLDRGLMIHTCINCSTLWAVPARIICLRWSWSCCTSFCSSSECCIASSFIEAAQQVHVRWRHVQGARLRAALQVQWWAPDGPAVI